MATYTNNCPPTCRLNDKTIAVRFLQSRLNRFGNYGLLIDGAFGAKTGEALKAFQTAKGISSDGICGPKTWRKLMNGGTTITHYLQGDPRWGKMMYSSKKDPKQTMANSGCGPTSLAIAMSAFGSKILPTDLAQFALIKGYRSENNGTYWGFFEAAGKSNDFDVKQMNDASLMCSALSQGKVVVASMAPGDFTKNGHYICIYDFDPYADILYVLDPASTARNSTTYKTIKSQGKQLWVVSAK